MYGIVTLKELVHLPSGVMTDVVAVELGTTTNVPDTEDPQEIFIVAAPTMWLFMSNILNMAFTDEVPEGIVVV